MQGFSLPVVFISTFLSVYCASAQAISQSADLTGSLSVNGDRFGLSVDIDGNNVIVGAPGQMVSNQTEAGAAYIFENGSEASVLYNGFANDFNGFGYSVAIDKDTAIVGAIHGDYYETVEQTRLLPDGNPDLDADGNEQIDLVQKVKTPDVGVIWIYRKIGADWWSEIGILNEGAKTGDWLGYSVDTEDNHIVAGSPLHDIGDTKPDAGSVYVFTRYTNDWRDDTSPVKPKIDEAVVMYELQPADLKAGDWFGSSVAISNNTIVVGADGSDLDGTSSGAAYVFTRNEDGSWQQQARLRPSDAGAEQFFGRDVAIDGNTLAVGAYQANSQKGAVYVFKRNEVGIWSEAAILTDSGSLIDDHFGASVAVSGSKVLVGAYRKDSRQGTLYLYEETINNTWTLASTTIIGASSYEDFSYSIAASADKVVVGIPELNNASSPGKIRIISDIDSEIDTDLDTSANNVDSDDDNDGVPDINDVFPTDNTEYSDIDQDGVGDNQDAFIYNATESFDSDGDGLGNNMDLDDDNDGILDVDEVTYGTDPLVANPDDAQTVADGIASADETTTDTTTTTTSSSHGSGAFDGFYLLMLLSMLLGRFYATCRKSRSG
jgi:hypothetical protein